MQKLEEKVTFDPKFHQVKRATVFSAHKRPQSGENSGFSRRSPTFSLIDKRISISSPRKLSELSAGLLDSHLNWTALPTFAGNSNEFGANCREGIIHSQIQGFFSEFHFLPSRQMKVTMHRCLLCESLENGKLRTPDLSSQFPSVVFIRYKNCSTEKWTHK